ncbi:hypothetical protein OXPF_00920 [Oxobacter pfennigii]|uniref:DUF327 domain-containing protein n=1 Tax=Oxobacter pfennigii TaxID=36849 RepID=A0A0P9ALP1_9CLOT|nr:YaaR family protein [Oxobacter pfennigii]KPU46305.1 hypothetical protein OXPF_00920 [Oxobacter pfennigii]
MEISKVSSDKQVKQRSVVTNKKLDKNFSEEFSSANKRESENRLGRLFEEIKKKGKRIIETHSVTAVQEYKAHIKEYLTLVLKDAYRIKKLRSMYNGNPATVVDVINKELDELANTILVHEKGTIEVVNKITSIEGLLIDIYQ